MYLKRHPETYQVVSALLCRVTLTTCLDINSISRFFDGLLALTLVFSLLRRFSVEFKSKLFAGQSTTFSLVFRRGFFTRGDVCFGFFCVGSDGTEPVLLLTAWVFLSESSFLHNSFHPDRIQGVPGALEHLHSGNTPTTAFHCEDGVLCVVHLFLLSPNVNIVSGVKGL